MIEAYIRPLYQRYCVDPIAKKLMPYVAPNALTLFAGLLGILVLPALWLKLPLFAVIMLLLSGYGDTLDGTLARMRQSSTATGTVLDIMMDRIVECAVILGLFSYDPLHRGWLCLLMIASMLLCITSFLVVGIFTPNTSEKSFYYSPGLMERAEAFLFFILLFWLPSYFSILSILFIVLVLVTAIIRIYQFYKIDKPVNVANM